MFFSLFSPFCFNRTEHGETCKFRGFASRIWSETSWKCIDVGARSGRKQRTNTDGLSMLRRDTATLSRDVCKRFGFSKLRETYLERHVENRRLASPRWHFSVILAVRGSLWRSKGTWSLRSFRWRSVRSHKYVCNCWIIATKQIKEILLAGWKEDDCNRVIYIT